MGERILTIYTSSGMLLHKQLPGGRYDCTSIKIFTGINLFNRD